MGSRRVLKVAEAIREVVSMAILTQMRDPRVCDVTVTFVEVSADLRHAKVHVSVMGDEEKQKLSLRGLQNSAGFLQQKVGKRIDTLYKIRKENAMMRQELARSRSPQPTSYSTQAPGITDYAVDALQQEAADRAASFIFDNLF
mgnify:CR=1 FL=1